ncbi:MAG: hypothetical protein ACRDH9_06250 [Actinomycetota bacterium]
MSPGLCSICGAILRDGACPNGHPQRAVQRGYSSPRRRRIFPILLLLLILAGVAYATLIWVPRNAARNLMQASSEDFSQAVVAYRGAANVLPPAATDPQVLADLAATAAAAAAPARDQLTEASTALVERQPLDLPVISSRPPLDEAIALRERMTEYYTTALQAITGLERAASYLTQAAAVLPALDSLERNANEADPDAPQAIAASSIPIADQLLADLQALTAPEELAGLHQSLLTIAQRIRDGLDALAGARGGEAGRPVVAATLKNVRDEIAAFRQTFGTAPRRARGAGLGPLLDEVDALTIEISQRLAALQDAGVGGIVLPGQSA